MPRKTPSRTRRQSKDAAAADHSRPNGGASQIRKFYGYSPLHMKLEQQYLMLGQLALRLDRRINAVMERVTILEKQVRAIAVHPTAKRPTWEDGRGM